MAIAFVEEQENSTNVSGSTLSLPSIAGGTDVFYILAVGRKGAGTLGVSSVTGGGLTWTEQTGATDPCGARDQTLLSLWTAFGSPAAFEAGATWASSAVPERSGIILSYSGASSVVDDPSSQNTLGDPASTCTGGTDNSTTSVSVTTVDATSTIITAVMTKNRTISTADADYVERGFVEVVGAQNELYIHDRIGAPNGTDNCSHTLSDVGDWVACGLAVRASGGAPTATVTLKQLMGVGL